MKRRRFLGILPVAGVAALTQLPVAEAAQDDPLPSKPSPENVENIRIWKLGDIENGIYPTESAVKKLADIIGSWDGESAFDIIWGPDLTLEQHLVYKDAGSVTDIVEIGKPTPEAIVDKVMDKLFMNPVAAIADKQACRREILKGIREAIEEARNAQNA
jgi:hypothetical protein